MQPRISHVSEMGGCVASIDRCRPVALNQYDLQRCFLQKIHRRDSGNARADHKDVRVEILLQHRESSDWDTVDPERSSFHPIACSRTVGVLVYRAYTSLV